MEIFLSIWQEEGCRMVFISFVYHDKYSANAHFIAHLMRRIMESQVLAPTPFFHQGDPSPTFLSFYIRLFIM